MQHSICHTLPANVCLLCCQDAARVTNTCHVPDMRFASLCMPMQVAQELGPLQFLQEDSLLPLVEQEYNSLSHPLSRSTTPQLCNLSAVSSRAAQHISAQPFTW